MVSFYVLAIFFVLGLSVLIAGELVVFLVLVRFGVARLMSPLLGKHIRVSLLVLKSFRLQKGIEFRIPLLPGDAPGLHKIVGQLCEKLAINFPQEIVLQMGDGAWVNLKGMRNGAGKTTLGVGYDLLAGLSVAEIEAVMAHEMTHAKLINRGLRNWAMAGQVRLRILANSLWAEVNAARRGKTSSHLARTLFAVVAQLLRPSTRLVAAYSRQDEFEADRGAAVLCGAEVMRSALSKLDSLHKITSRLPWNERVAQLQQTSGYSQWLLQEIAQGSSTVLTEDPNQALYNKYSTHPLIRDRLAALPPDNRLPAANSPSGIQLLAHPDEIANKLLMELQRLSAEQERKDSQALEKFSRRAGKGAHLSSWQSFGALAVLGGIICGLAGLASQQAGMIVPCALAAIVGGVIAFRLGRYCDRLDLAVPNYEKLVRPEKTKLTAEKTKEMESSMEAELTNRFAQQRKLKRSILLAQESYAALADCDYLRAHVAARSCLKVNKKSVEGALALAVACASFGQIPTTARLLAFVQKHTGFKTFSTAWGAAWAALLASDWGRAEAMLEQALKSQPEQTTLLSFLAITQSRRGKLQSSIMNARRAHEADLASREKTKYLIARLLDGGYTREAREKIEQMNTHLTSDVELMLSMAQLNLLQRNADEAARWTDRIKQSGGPAQMLVRLGKIHEIARLKDRAAGLYQEALVADHFPEAHLGLGRLETERNNKAEARQHLLAALNVERPVGKEGVATWQMLQPILTQMLGLHDPLPNCRGGLHRFPAMANPPPWPGKTSWFTRLN